MSDVFWFVVPCYNESENLPVSAPILLDKINSLIDQGKISQDSKILFINDGSSDDTWEIICSLNKKSPHFVGISLAHNSGENNAALAGIFTAADYADFVITIDSDLQDDINAVDRMIEHYKNGCDIVYGVRNDRNSDPLVIRFTSFAFYKVMKKLKSDFVAEHSQYRLMSKKAILLLREFEEKDIFLPALVPSIGLKSATVEHIRHPRLAGKTHYNFSKRLGLAINAITSFSNAPLSIITVFAIIAFLFSAVGTVALILLSCKENAINIPSLIFSSFFLSACHFALSENMYIKHLLNQRTDRDTK